MKSLKLNRNHRILLFVIALILLFVIILSILVWGFSPEPMSKLVFTAMDTNVELKTSGENSSEYKDRVLELDKMFNCYNTKSEIYELNKSMTATLSDETIEIINKAKELEKVYPECDITAGGLINLWDPSGTPRVPSEQEIAQALADVDINNLTINGNTATLSKGEINLGCCAKGYACDIIKEMLDENNESYAIVSFGSSSLLYGKKPRGESFNVGIKNPLEPDEEMGTLKVNECFISTSGSYERAFTVDDKEYSHIFNLKNGYPVETDLLSVTVIGKSGIESDFVSTCIFMNGVAGLEYYLNLQDFQVIAIDKDQNVYISNSIKNNFKITNDSFSFAK
ncbi:MAG: FAD:protein FMN transferase [Clostridiales bacterium]|nr:FAD:protein FMN transferase [Clostridiales bacterium]